MIEGSQQGFMAFNGFFVPAEPCVAPADILVFIVCLFRRETFILKAFNHLNDHPRVEVVRLESPRVAMVDERVCHIL